MSDLTDAQLRKALASERYAALRHLDRPAADLNQWSEALPRDPRLLVPVDVQALLVRPDDTETMIRLPLRDGTDPAPDLTNPGTGREPGVHLLWSVPEALGQGRIVDDPADPDNVDRRRLELPLLPDRWVITRFIVPTGARRPRLRGWVLEADAGTVTPLTEWPGDGSSAVSVAPAFEATDLHVQIGGPSWTSCYDAAIGRLSFHDPLDDLNRVGAGGIEGDAIGYAVAGWWSDPQHDPLAGVGSLHAYWERLAELGWDDVDHPADFGSTAAREERAEEAADTVGLPYHTRLHSELADDPGIRFGATASRFLGEAGLVSVLPLPPSRATLLHGRIHGVPISGPRPDNRPETEAVGATLGLNAGEVTAALASTVLDDGAGESRRRDLERLVAGLGAGVLPRLTQADMWSEIDQDGHRRGFASVPGGVEAVDRFVPAPPKGPDPKRRSSARTRKRGGREPEAELDGRILWANWGRPGVLDESTKESRKRSSDNRPAVEAPDFRAVERAAPRFHHPTAPVLAVSGVGRHLSAVEIDEADGVLRCRTSDQVSTGLDGIFSVADVLPALGSGAVPDETKLLVREALAADPHLVRWRIRVIDSDNSLESVLARARAEAVIDYTYYGGSDELLAEVVRAPVTGPVDRQAASEYLIRHSLDGSVRAHREGVTMWGQPWRPVFCEWEVEVELTTGRQWRLGETDLEPVPDDGDSERRTIPMVGRSPVTDGVAGSLQGAIDRWLRDERARDALGRGLADRKTEQALAGLMEHLDRLDLLSVALDGIRERLLGLVYDRGLMSRNDDDAADGTPRTRVDRDPELVIAGRLTLTAARLVDSFGRRLDIPVAEANRPVRSAADAPATVILRPRLTAPARLHLRLVDPLATGADAATAVVDQTAPDGGINPVAGFLLPDHIDESLEFFSSLGVPLGQVFHDGFSDAVTWEGAPGRTDVGPGAGPLDDGVAKHRRVGWMASALVAHDAEVRQAGPTRPTGTQSSLAAMLQAIDTTLWTVDPFGSLGREHIAGLVGRPMAVVTARLTLDVPPDLDQHLYLDTTREDRERAYRELAATAFEVRLGTVSRTDDGLLGYFVDDDYSRMFVVDRVIAEQTADVDGPISSDYIVPDGTIEIRHGQTVNLTLLMHPGGRVHLTSGILPRQAVALSREWVHPGLRALAPSARVGPLLIDVEKVRLPKIAAFPVDQLFTRRDSPASWRDDPIVSATQSAYLPDQSSVVQEGWIRIAPTSPEAGDR